MSEETGAQAPENDVTLTDTSVVSEAAPAADETPVAEPVESSSEETSEKEWTLDEAVAEVKRLREESGTYRTQRNRFSEAFDGYEDETVDAYLSAVRAIREDPKAAYEAFSELTAALADATGMTTKEAEEAVQGVLDETESDDDEVLTKSGLDKALAEREEAKVKADAQRAAEQEVNSTIADLGYKPETPEYTNLLFYATKEESGSAPDKLRAAHERVQADKQRVIDEFLANESAKNDNTPPQTDGAAAVPSRQKPNSINNAAKAARAALDAQYSESSDD